jgi:cbb3-type cytochrome oxidase maturation protein
VSLLLVGISLWAFFWATNAGQFDDLESAGLNVLADERDPRVAEGGEPAEPKP